MSDDAPWLRQPGESEVAFEAFTTFMNAADGSRSVRGVAKALHKSVTQVSRWSSKFDWRERHRAWVAHVDKAEKDAEVESIRAAKRKEMDAIHEMRARHVNMSAGLTKLAGMDLQAWIYAMEQDRAKAKAEGKVMPPPRLAPKDIRALMEAGIKLERISRGEPDTITEQQADEIENAEKRRRLRPLAMDPRALEPLRALADSLANTNPELATEKLIASIVNKKAVNE
jgi:hypothetical protein